MVFLAAENENQQMEGLPPADIGGVHENISFFGKEKVNNWEYCEKKVTPFVCFCNGSTHFKFSSWPLSPTHFATFFRGLGNLQFHSIKKVDFSFQ